MQLSRPAASDAETADDKAPDREGGKRNKTDCECPGGYRAIRASSPNCAPMLRGRPYGALVAMCINCIMHLVEPVECEIRRRMAQALQKDQGRDSRARIVATSTA